MDHRPRPDDCREIERESLADGRFVALERLRYRDPAGRERLWEAAVRVPRGRPAVAAVTRFSPGKDWLLVRQYRPPAGRPVLEFPAGLVDDGEEPGAAALRELREETGYRGKLRALYPAAYSSPGLSDESVHIALVDIDEDDPENRAPDPRPEDGEYIEALRVPQEGVEDFLRARIAAGDGVDGKVLSFFLGRADR